MNNSKTQRFPSGVAVDDNSKQRRVPVRVRRILDLIRPYTFHIAVGTCFLFVVYLSQKRYGYTAPVHTTLCPHKVRVGSQGDGGWWMCSNETTTAAPCVVYSFGIRDNFSFDHDLAKQYACQVHGFDPSPAGLVSQAAYEETPNLHYHSVGLGKADELYAPGKVPFRWPGMEYLAEANTLPWRIQRLPTIMKTYQHKRLAILKIDIEGGEWDALPDVLFNAEWDELYIELHFPPWQYRLSTAPRTGGLTVVRRTHRLRSLPARNVDGPVDRIGLLQQLIQVADLFHWEFNGVQCVEMYFRRKPRRVVPHPPWVWFWRDRAE